MFLRGMCTVAVAAVALAVALLATSALVDLGAAGASTPSTTEGASPVGPVGHAGRWLTDSQGRVLLLHGVNVVAKDAPYYPSAFGFDNADAAFLAANGMRVVRLGVMASGEMPTEGKIDESYIDKLIATVNELGHYGIFTLLDWHQDDYGTYFNDPGTVYRADGFPAWMTVTNGAANNQVVFPLDYTSDAALQQAFQAFWDDEKVPGGLGLQEYDTEMLQAVAKRVAKNPWVLGYEVMNEPWPGTDWGSCLIGGCPLLEKSELDPFYAKAAAAIRSVDRDHMIFFEPFSTYNFGYAPTHIALPAGVTNTGMAYHQYAQTPSAQVQVFTNSLDWAASTGGALLNTEWSSSGGTPASITEQATDEDNALMPWIYWVFDNCDIACGTAQSANFLLNPKAPPTGSNVNAPIVNSVVRPYPIAVAGTPLELSYDTTDQTLDFSWSDARATGIGAKAGPAFGPGALTTFAIPSRDYPNGYRVQASGARVVSGNCDSTLVLAQVGHPSTLSVTVSPGNSCHPN